LSPLARKAGAWSTASWLRCHPDKSTLLLIKWGKQSGVMVGIISTPLGGCVPATYYSCSQFWLAFHFLLSNWNPKLIEKDIFPHIYPWLPFLQSRPHSCDSRLHHLQTHHCLAHPHRGLLLGIFGSRLEMLAAGLPCSGCAVLASALICKAPRRPEAGLPTCKDSSYPLPSGHSAPGEAFLLTLPPHRRWSLWQSPAAEGTSGSPRAPSSPEVLAFAA